MDPKLLSFLRCPASGGPLALQAIDMETYGHRQLVRTGVLSCELSKLWYPIVNFVPVMLTFPTPLTQSFARAHPSLIGRLEGFGMPSESPMRRSTACSRASCCII